MKSAVSIDDSLMAQADEAARDLGLSRCGLIAKALREFLRNRRGTQITEKLNQVYDNGPTRKEMRLVRKLKAKLPLRDCWPEARPQSRGAPAS